VGQVISIQNATIFQRDKMVLKDVNLSLSENEIVYIIGKTGTGKSSLLKMLYGEIGLNEGTGTVVGFDLTRLKKSDVPMLRRKIGIVFQDFQLLTDRSVGDNLRFVLKATGWSDKAQIEQRVSEVLAIVGLENKINIMPYALSGGEQQRITIARALLNEPELILADEPTGNLDPETSEEIMRVLMTIAEEQKTAVLMATHDMSIVDKFPHRVLRVENNMIKEVESLSAFDPFNAKF
jgi:cell division transport system ATP-binding protein